MVREWYRGIAVNSETGITGNHFEVDEFSIAKLSPKKRHIALKRQSKKRTSNFTTPYWAAGVSLDTELPYDVSVGMADLAHEAEHVLWHEVEKEAHLANKNRREAIIKC